MATNKLDTHPFDVGVEGFVYLFQGVGCRHSPVAKLASNCGCAALAVWVGDVRATTSAVKRITDFLGCVIHRQYDGLLHQEHGICYRILLNI